jgi:hypothetical protein
MKAAKLARDIDAYVSFRVKDRTFWTNRKVRLRKGEIVLGDGTHWVRGRCGNLISFVPECPFLPPASEPSEVDFDTPYPEIPPQLAELRIPDLTGPLPEFRSPEPEPVVAAKPAARQVKQVANDWTRGMAPLPARPFPERRPLPPEAIVDAPEPSSILLVGAGIIVLAGLARRRSI